MMCHHRKGISIMPMHSIQKIFIILLSLFFIPTAFALNTQVSTPNTVTSDNTWKIEVAPYIWALSMNGTVQVGPRARAHVDQSFSDILSQLNWAGMVWLEANKNKFGIFANIIYSSLSDDASVRSATIKTKNEFGLYTAGVSYQIYQACLLSSGCSQNTGTIAIEPYAGLRYTSNKATVTLSSPIISLRAVNNQDWTDPIIGARLKFALTNTWHAILSGDIGGTNASSHYSYNLVGVIGYKPQTHWVRTTWYLGYRLLDQHYATGNGANYFNWNMKLFGPLIGVSFTF